MHAFALCHATFLYSASGDWLCPGCDVLFGNVDELRDPNTVLSYASNDPY
jgi:hypothetical protein